jgi:hypothetical protein
MRPCAWRLTARASSQGPVADEALREGAAISLCYYAGSDDAKVSRRPVSRSRGAYPSSRRAFASLAQYVTPALALISSRRFDRPAGAAG